MNTLIASVMLFAALLADLWLGNYGLTPFLAVYVLFHASRSVSLTYATAAALLLGIVVDLVYCRGSSGSPLAFMLALYAGRLALFRRAGTGAERWLQVILAGGALGMVLTLYRMLAAGGAQAWTRFGAALDLSLGVASGVLKLALTVLLLDFCCGYLGLPGFFPPELRNGKNSNAGRSRRRRVLAANVAGRGK
ncbi:MAG: hypothetical protein IJJ28_08635 [Lentisphaeria bacterium]|nr:hypothetical protein [Lentisphaeria bacterium]